MEKPNRKCWIDFLLYRYTKKNTEVKGHEREGRVYLAPEYGVVEGDTILALMKLLAHKLVPT